MIGGRTDKRKSCPHGAHPMLCETCILERVDAESEQRELDELAHAAWLVRQAAPATDREWEEHLAACGYGEAD